MTTLLLILWFAVLLALLFILACHPERTKHSWSELKRRGDDATMRREQLLEDVLALKRFVVGIGLISLAVIGLALWQTPGVLLTIIIWTVVGMVVRWRPLRTFVMKRYGAIEPQLLMLVERSPIIGQLLRDGKYVPHDQQLESEYHLLHLVENSGHILNDDQKSFIRSGVNWHATKVGSIMTPVKNIISVKHTELLGPLVLDDLHQSGHSRFPVIKGSIDNVVGVLDITDSLEVSTARSSPTVEQAMSSDVRRIPQDGLLPEALALLQKGRNSMLIVVDNDDKTVGVVALSDIIVSLLGKNRGEMVK